MKTQHTQGEWEIDGNSIFPKGLSSNIAIIQERTNEDETIANAKLIAAAPELLEALNNLLNHLSGKPKICGHDYECICPYDLAKNAIKKATI